MRLLKTHSHTSERPGYEARKNAKKVIEGNVDTVRRQTIRQNLPRTASVAGGGETKKALWQDQPPSKPSHVSSAWRGGRDEERRIEGEHRREDKENQSQNPPVGYHLSLIHISEPTRPRLISYAVFCLKKKIKTHEPSCQAQSRKRRSKP